jgi:hypothetical protein
LVIGRQPSNVGLTAHTDILANGTNIGIYLVNGQTNIELNYRSLIYLMIRFNGSTLVTDCAMVILNCHSNQDLTYDGLVRLLV